jgi:DNA-directed RNA polymerase subunit RPC12/RpoP
MDADPGRIDDAPRSIVCPHCGHRQMLAAGGVACERCGYRFSEDELAGTELVGTPIPGVYYPEDVAPSLTAGGIGDPTDGTQVVHRVTTAVPGKPMAPIADDPDLRLNPGEDEPDLPASPAGARPEEPA